MTTNLSRRGFLATLAALPAVAALPALPVIAPKFTLWGDGIHNDAPALNALMRGEGADVLFMPGTGAWDAVENVITLGTERIYALGAPVIIGSKASGLTLDGTGAELLSSGDWGIQVERECKNVALKNMLLTGNGENAGLDVRGNAFMESMTVQKFSVGIREPIGFNFDDVDAFNDRDNYWVVTERLPKASPAYARAAHFSKSGLLGSASHAST